MPNLTDTFRRATLSLLSPAGKRARLMILTFHQVPAAPDPIQPNVPDATLFERQMTWLRDFCNVLPLPEAARRLEEGSLPARAACITFDDGYEDNLTVAAPILRTLGLPATFFITVGAVEQGIMWNDLVIEGVRRAQGNVDLEAFGLGRHQIDNNDNRRSVIGELIKTLKYRPLDERFAAATTVYTVCAEGEPPRLMMRPDQVRELAVQGFDVGAHTVNHPILKELTAAHARQEIEGSRDWVEQVTGSRPVSFAYPNGRPGIDFSGEHEKLVSAAGFSCAVSTQWACAKHGDSLYSLPRFTPWEGTQGTYWSRLLKTAGRSYLGPR